jgi:steroid 5-alpha reductase family enzyme
MIILSHIFQSAACKSVANDGKIFNHLFHSWITIMLIAALVCFVVGELTRNYSQVDKIWSLMPIVYSFITFSAFSSSPRIRLMALLVTIWGLRLSYNFFRKGGYNIIPWKGEEDYRWNVLRQNPKLQGLRIIFFNLFFISFYQHVLILLFSSPLLLAAKYANVGLNALDYLAVVFMLLFILIETIADNQLFNFQQQKQHKMLVNGKFSNSLSKGFMIEGLWKYVRHPNFISEQLIWVSFYFFGVAASGQWINWTLTGPLLLILLFVGSSEFTESISIKKYSDYLDYKQNVPKFIPLIFKSKQGQNSHQ